MPQLKHFDIYAYAHMTYYNCVFHIVITTDTPYHYQAYRNYFPATRE